MWLGLSLIDWLIIVAFLVGLVVVGVRLSARVKDETDYFMGGRRYGKVLMIFFSFASATSSDEAVQVTAGTWRAGLAGIRGIPPELSRYCFSRPLIFADQPHAP